MIVNTGLDNMIYTRGYKDNNPVQMLPRIDYIIHMGFSCLKIFFKARISFDVMWYQAWI